MKNSKVQIFNITLNILGVSTPLENVNLNENRTILLNNYYELARDYVLKDFDWNFASCFRKLSATSTNNTLTKYKGCWDYPNDCICARDLIEEGSYKLVPFEVSALEDGQKVILCDIDFPILRYTKRIEQEVNFSCEFTMALTYYLASLTSNVITGSIQKGELAFEKYKQIIKHARLLNAKEGTDYIYDDSTYLDSRG